MLAVSSRSLPSFPSVQIEGKIPRRASSSLNRREQRQQRVGRAATILSVSPFPPVQIFAPREEIEG